MVIPLLPSTDSWKVILWVWNDLPPGLRQPDCHLQLSDINWRLFCLATAVHRDSYCRIICAIQIFFMYVCMYCLWRMASATPDLRLPSQLTLVPNLYCLVTVDCPVLVLVVQYYFQSLAMVSVDLNCTAWLRARCTSLTKSWELTIWLSVDALQETLTLKGKVRVTDGQCLQTDNQSHAVLQA